jgi:predicted RNase H-like HicB family nuclease
MILFGNMIEAYLDSQMKRANYELIDKGVRFYAEIKGIQGVWATGKTLEECRENLLSSLEGWFILSLQKNLPIPHFKTPRVKMAKRVHA